VTSGAWDAEVVYHTAFGSEPAPAELDERSAS
jgi:hypothetical protein